MLVGERFELVREIGAGGYGRVYEAHDRDLDRRVAVKVLDLGDSDVALREGKALAEFHHDHVVAIYDHGVGPDYRYFVLQYVEGPPLHVWCRDNTAAKAIVGVYMQAGAGLAAIHAKGLVHGDFKPANVRVGPEGKAVVLDFGLARHHDTLERDREAEDPPVFRGTLDHAPPERLLGKPSDARSDQFSFCVALWEALTGVNPFGACTEATTIDERVFALALGLEGRPPGSRRVERALRRGLSMQPEERFPSMQALLAALSPKPRRRWSWREMLIAGGACVMLGGLMTLLVLPRGGGSLEFVTDTQIRWAGQEAILAANEGNVDGALRRLEAAKRAQISDESSRELALASEDVALEFERQELLQDALLAWQLAILFARDVGDLKLEQQAQSQFDAVAALIYVNSAS
ncbi:Serine/threonine kinase PKN8 [Enhygromyxa salina]|uniref:Serine/threonine kinase PKN8 n=1 Tax=Enhygromyxa salina TaxID=215803 RepID=A0A0C2CWG0_9BACT|nr:serine/threonine-protein kinase [Enhygromyxa salina]KIG12187.1 Serine/threonine kinase PKN8 [Enhygromyxa salina]